MKISLELEVSYSYKYISIDPSDLNLTDMEWVNLSKEEKEERLRDYVDYLPEQPYWMVNEYEEED